MYWDWSSQAAMPQYIQSHFLPPTKWSSVGPTFRDAKLLFSRAPRQLYVWKRGWFIVFSMIRYLFLQHMVLFVFLLVNNSQSTNADLMLGQRLRHWPNIKSALVHCLKSAGYHDWNIYYDTYTISSKYSACVLFILCECTGVCRWFGRRSYYEGPSAHNN